MGFSWRACPAQTVVDGFPETRFGYRHDSDRGRLQRVQRSQIRKKIGRGLAQVSGWTEVESRLRRKRTESQKRLTGQGVHGVEPQRRPWRLMAEKLARRLHFSLAEVHETAAQNRFDILAGNGPRAQKGGPRRERDNR